MAVKIRLKRMGKKKQPSYRVVVADSRSPRDGRIIESIGRYDPRQDPSLIEIDNERAQYWLGNGAQPTERAQKLLEISGAVEQSQTRGGVYRLDAASTPPAAEAAVEEAAPEVATEPAEEEVPTEEVATPEEEAAPADEAESTDEPAAADEEPEA